MSRRIKGALLTALMPVFFAGLSRAEDSTFRLSISTGATYDTNALLLPKSGRHECIRLNVSECGGDYELTVSPRMEIMNEHKQYTLDLQYSPTVNFYLGHPHLDYVSQAASAGVSGEISEKTRFYLKDAYTYTVESFQATGILMGRGGVTANSASLGGDHDLTARSNVSLGLTDDEVWLKFPGTVSSRTDSAGLTGTHKLTDNLSIRGTYAFTNIYFDSGFNENIENHTLSAGLNYRATPTLVLDVSGGAFYTPDIRQYNWIGSATVSKTFQRSALTAGYARALVATGLAAQEAVNQLYNLMWSYSLTDKFDAGVSGNYARYKTIPNTTLDLSSYTAGLSGTWRPNSWTTLTAGLTHFNQWSKGLLGEAFSRSTVFVNLTVVPFERRF